MSDKPESTPNTTAPETQDTPQASPPATSQGSTEGTPEAKFTQTDVDAIATRARKEARDIERKKLMEDLGVENFDSLKSLLQEHQKRKEADMSELEKAQAEIEKERAKAQKAMDDLTALQAQMVANGRKSAFLQAVQDNGGKKADRLFALVQSLYADDYAAAFGSDATPNEATLKRFIQKLQNEEPEYFGSAGAGNPSSANGISPIAKDTQIELQDQMRVNARRTF